MLNFKEWFYLNENNDTSIAECVEIVKTQIKNIKASDIGISDAQISQLYNTVSILSKTDQYNNIIKLISSLHTKRQIYKKLDKIISELDKII